MIRVGEANVSIERREAFIGGMPVPLGTRAFDVLEKLMASPNRLVTKQELLDAAWPDLFVEENNLAVQIHALRRHLKLDRKMLETMPRRGYRLNVTPAPAPVSPRAEEGILEISYDESRGIISRVQGKEAIRCFLGALLGKVPEFERHNVRFLINMPDGVLGE
ncbi:winged helix-turn-helix domain-containing protein [Pseudomonas putida]